VRDIDGEAMFVIPRLRLDRLVVMPQPPRAERVGEATHDQASLPGHSYLATYLFVREGLRADALIHFGTHGTQEWTPGKDRGLWVNDFPFLTLGDLPVFYPYIQDNVGEAVQAKRRGRAVTISHQTPAFAPAGLYDELRDLHALVHEYQQLEDGGVRTRTQQALLAAAQRAGLIGDMGWRSDAARDDFAAFFNALHDHLHELARSAMPLGLHTFGEPAAPGHRLATVMQQLGEPYYHALGLDPAEVFAEDFTQLQASPPYRLLHRHLREGVPLDDVHDDALRGLLRRAQALDAALADTQEIESLLAALAGGFVRAGAGGDPIRNPDLRSGRNLFPFEPDRIPTRAAYEAGGEALEQLLAAYRDEHGGRTPEKLAFSLWSSEAIRHLGVLESQVLHALGLRPVWNEGGRVTALEIVPEHELKRPRIDAVVQVTSVYRDQFDGFMRMLAQAIDRLAAQGGTTGNPIARNSDAVERTLIERGVAPERARQLARLRVFGNAPGEYGSGLPDAVLAEADDKRDATLAQGFLQRLQYGYGANEWGATLGTGHGNLFAEQLRGVQAAVLARSSNLHGMLSTDHPFEYLGGLSLAVRHLDGTSPALYVSDLRGQRPRTSSAKNFLAAELRSRQLNPQWIQAMQQEGYAGTLQVLDTVNNLFGWQLTDPSMVRNEQWQAIHDTYVRDVRRLGVDEWFERANPTAQLQMISRMREAIERGHWKADARTRAELRRRQRELADMTSTRGGSVEPMPAGAGFGLGVAAAPARGGAASAAASTPASAPAPDAAAPAPAKPAPPQVRGRVLREVAQPEPAAANAWRTSLGLALLALCLGLGAWRQRRTTYLSIHPEPSR
jgi:cobaltochelatase CobN